MLGSARLGYGKVLLDGGCSGTTVIPQTQRVRLVRLSLFGCDLTTSISSPGKPRTSPGKSARAHKQTTAQATIQEVLHRSRCFAHRSSRARGLIRGWIQTAWRMDALPKKSHQRSQSTGCVLVRKAPTTPHSQATAPQAKDRGGLQGRPRWGLRQLTEAECQCPVHLVRL